MSAPEASPRFSGRMVSAPLPVRSRPRTGNWLVHRADDGRTVLLDPSVLATAYRVEQEHAPAETGGLLFGRAFVDSEGPYVVVSYAIPPRRGEVIGAVSTVKITAAGAGAMTERAQAQRFEADVVGWYHTHPSFAAYFSTVDEAEQSTWASALAVGLVVAGVARRDDRHKVYVGPESTRTRLQPRADRQPAIEAAPASFPDPLPGRTPAPPAALPPRLVEAVRQTKRSERGHDWVAPPPRSTTPAFAPANWPSPAEAEPVPAAFAAASVPIGDPQRTATTGLMPVVILVVVVLVAVTAGTLGYFVTREDGSPPPNRIDNAPADRRPAAAGNGTAGAPASEGVPGASSSAGNPAGARP
jgi:proteasome lid subunit RPN8/RPN11